MESTGLHFFSTIFLCIFINPYYAGSASSSQNYYGKLIGNLTHYAHDVNGTAYAVDESTIFIKNFSYDGMAASAFFWVGNESAPTPYGIMVPYPSDKDEREEPKPLGKFRNKDIILKLPSGIKIRDIKWLCVWCRRFTVNLGSVNIPPDLEAPKIRVLPEFLRLAHGLRSGNISILDSKTFYIPNLHYDGTGPDAYFWVGTGKEPNTLGVKVPSETKSLEPLRGYQGEDIEIVLPDDLTVYNIDWLAVWCVEYRHNFGHVMIPKHLDVPPALGQTQITPPWWYNPTSTPSLPPNIEHDLSNCKEMLEGRLQVQWEVFGDDVKIRISARIDEDQYVAFGLSGEDGKSQMLGGDVVVVAYDKHSKKFFAEDYYLSDLSQCDGKRGVCPDERIGGKNDAIYIDGKRNNGITTVIYMRPLQTNEPEKDKIIPETYTSVIAAIGTLNSNGEANTHQSSDRTTEDIRIDFNSKNVHECTNSLYNLPESNEIDPWPIMEVMDTDEFTVRIGPTGGKRGYSYITGQTNWGIAWYINDLLIPEVYIERGQNYTFIVEGGNDPSNPARYNPFYITDSAEGGLAQKNKTEQEKQKVFAGVEYDEQGYPYPTAAGRYCSWNHKTVDMSAESRTFEDFFKTLKLECDPGEPAQLIWSVADDTPDLLYYQSYSHINLGWKIHVVDPGYSSHRNSGSTVIPTSWTITLALFLGFYKILLLVR